MTNTLVGSTVREIVANSADKVRVAGTVREVVANSADKVRVAGVVREVVMEGPPLVASRVMAWRMGW